MNNFVFFGSSRFSVICLEELKRLGIAPTLIVTTPDQPKGRKLILTKTGVKIWAEQNSIDCLSPEKLDADFIYKLEAVSSNLYLVASYGKILPKKIIELPKYGTLNIHPSLLPKYRGPSPIQEQILNNEQNIGVSLMKMDEQVDHGPIIARQGLSLALEGESLSSWPVSFTELEKITAEIGAKLFLDKLDDFITGKIIPIEQDHASATLTKKVKKEDGLLDIVNSNPYQNYLKFLAYSDWPKTYFFAEKYQGNSLMKIRVKIVDAEFTDGQFIIKKVVPEGKKEMSYQDFLRGVK